MTNLILTIAGDSADAKTLADVLRKAEDGPFDIEWVTRLSDALERLRAFGGYRAR